MDLLRQSLEGLVREALAKVLDRFPPSGPLTIVQEATFDGSQATIDDRSAIDYEAAVTAIHPSPINQFCDFPSFFRSVQASRRRIDALLAAGGSDTGTESRDLRRFFAESKFSRFFSYYIEEVQGFQWSDEAFETVYADLISWIKTPVRRGSLVSPLTSFSSDIDRVDVTDSLSITRFTDEEKKDVWRREERNRSSGESTVDPSKLLSWTHLARARFEVPRHDNRALPDSSYSLMMELVTALRLLQSGFVATTIFWQEPDRREFRFGGLWGPLQEPPHWPPFGGDYVLTEEKISDLSQLLERLHVVNERSVLLALRRFDSAYERKSDEDKLLDLWIALEALFAPDGHGELTYRLSTRIARFLESSPACRRDQSKRLKKLYDLRSKVVHGKTRTPDFQADLIEVEEVVRRSLRLFLDSSVCHDADTLDFV